MYFQNNSCYFFIYTLFRAKQLVFLNSFQHAFMHIKTTAVNNNLREVKNIHYLIDLKEVIKNNVIDFKDGDLPTFVFEYGLLNL